MKSVGDVKQRVTSRAVIGARFEGVRSRHGRASSVALRGAIDARFVVNESVGLSKSIEKTPKETSKVLLSASPASACGSRPLTGARPPLPLALMHMQQPPPLGLAAEELRAAAGPSPLWHPAERELDDQGVARADTRI